VQVAMNTGIEALKCAYVDLAAELRAMQVGLQNDAAHLATFIAARDQLRLHPNFSGALPETFYSGSDLDPDGVEGKQGLDWCESGQKSWT